MEDVLLKIADMIEELPAYEGASPSTLRAAAAEIVRLREELNGWRARAEVSEALLTAMERRK